MTSKVEFAGILPVPCATAGRQLEFREVNEEPLRRAQLSTLTCSTIGGFVLFTLPSQTQYNSDFSIEYLCRSVLLERLFSQL
ncbi:hypothetical protein FKM82_024392 [Ascaphus truei]